MIFAYDIFLCIWIESYEKNNYINFDNCKDIYNLAHYLPSQTMRVGGQMVDCLLIKNRLWLLTYLLIKKSFMRKRDFFLAGLLFMAVPAFAQIDQPEFTAQDAKVIFNALKRCTATANSTMMAM